MQQVEFEIVPASEVNRVCEALDSLVAASLPGYPPSSIALMRAGYVLRDGLYVEARRELLAALAKDPDEPTLHVLLGQVYDNIGLGELAQREFIEARDLSPRSGG
jgi:Flp pilus assembly protein TadD